MTGVRRVLASAVRRLAAGLVAAVVSAGAAGAQALTPAESRMREWIRRHRDDQIASLERVVRIPSGTMDLAGVRRTAEVFRATLDSLGFDTRWVPLERVRRAGHLVAERRGRRGGPTILLIGHLDTVHEGASSGWVRRGSDSLARGPGANDMKGGNAVLVYALKALEHAGALGDATLLVVLTGDEERVGHPLAVSRRDLMDAGRRADVALGFEPAIPGAAVVARRGASTWRLEAAGRQAHSSGVFREGVGYGAIYEVARILEEFRARLSPVPNLSFNPGLLVGGTEAHVDSSGVRGSAAGKTNVVAPRAIVTGDLRFLSDRERDSARAVMREIVARSLPGASATIEFTDAYPAMAPTEGNRRLLDLYDQVSRALGQGPVLPADPSARGAADISFVAPYVPAALDGLGPSGSGAHSPDETVNLNSLVRQTERAAVLLYRVARGGIVLRTE